MHAPGGLYNIYMVMNDSKYIGLSMKMIGEYMKIILDDGTALEIGIDRAIIEDILSDLEINPVEVIVSKNGKIVSELDLAESDDQIKIIRIIHGG